VAVRELAVVAGQRVAQQGDEVAGAAADREVHPAGQVVVVGGDHRPRGQPARPRLRDERVHLRGAREAHERRALADDRRGAHDAVELGPPRAAGLLQQRDARVGQGALRRVVLDEQRERLAHGPVGQPPRRVDQRHELRDRRARRARALRQRERLAPGVAEGAHRGEPGRRLGRDPAQQRRRRHVAAHVALAGAGPGLGQVVVDHERRAGEGAHPPVEDRRRRGQRPVPRHLAAPQQHGGRRRLAARPQRDGARGQAVGVGVRHDGGRREEVGARGGEVAVRLLARRVGRGRGHGAPVPG
jgi:hypothetical protein